MKRARAALLLAGLLLAAPAGAQDRRNSPYIAPLGYCQLTSVSAATLISTCSGGIPSLAQWALIQVEGNAARWRDDGTNPTASVGQPLPVGSPLYYQSLLSAFSIIPQTGSMTIDISFYSGVPGTTP